MLASIITCPSPKFNAGLKWRAGGEACNIVTRTKFKILQGFCVPQGCSALGTLYAIAERGVRLPKFQEIGVGMGKSGCRGRHAASQQLRRYAHGSWLLRSNV